jgi:predicted amidohydrolase YtcJ
LIAHFLNNGDNLEKADILILGCIILSMKNESTIEDGAIAIRNGKIIFIGKFSHLTNIKAEKTINAKGKTAMSCCNGKSYLTL